MESLIVNKYMKLIEPLSMDMKLELLSELTNNIKNDSTNTALNVDKKKLLEELSGSWKDVDENIIEEIYKNRAIAQKEISLE